MGKTVIEKIIGKHASKEVSPDDIVDMKIDARIARDFGGANVVKNLESNSLSIDDPQKTFFTFDCNPTGSDQKYATNQQTCRDFARKTGITIYDINAGIGTHLAIDEGLISPGGTLVSTDSHANILGAIGAFGQGMGDKDIAYAFAKGSIWFKVPSTVKIALKGKPSQEVTAKDVILALLKELGAAGLLGCAAELYGDYVDDLGIDERITIASMATEAGGICLLLPPNEKVLDYCKRVANRDFTPVYADQDAGYARTIEVDMGDLTPLISRPGHPEDVVPVAKAEGKKIGSVFIGSCTNGRYEDMAVAANILKGRKVAPGVVLKIVPSTDEIWQRCLDEGMISTFKKAGALVGNAGCAGCAAGQIGQNGPGEITVSTGNRNFAGKQGKGEVFLSSPCTAAASAVAGHITTSANIPDKPSLFVSPGVGTVRERASEQPVTDKKSTRMKGRVWVVSTENIDTDMIYHNRHLAVTDINEMGQYAFGNLEGWQDFPKKAKPGDILIVGGNFGCGSSRQQAVDCFRALKTGMIIADSFGAIYERNAINAGFPVMVVPEIRNLDLHDGDEIEVDFVNGEIKKSGTSELVHGVPFSEVQLDIYHREGLLS